MADKNSTATFGTHIRTLFSVGAMGANSLDESFA
jgi:hypothetical protein